MLSIVIPTLNAENELEATINAVARAKLPSEIIVADGGSTDATPAITAKTGAAFIAVPGGRGPQLTAGAAVSAQQEGLLALSQQSLFPLASLAYHDYEGVALRDDEKARLQADLGNANFMILRNQFYSDKRRSWRQSQLDQEAAERTLVAVDNPEAPVALDELRQALASLPENPVIQ